MKESRRGFLKAFPRRALVVSSVIGALGSAGCERSNNVINSTNIQNAKIESSLAESAVHGFALAGLNYTSTRLGVILGVPIGNAYAVKEMQDRHMSIEEELTTVAAAVTLSPAIEEWLFRLYPSRMFAAQDTTDRWDVGAVSSLAYALFHNLNISRAITKKEPPILTDRIPLPQLVSGMFLWQKFRQHERVNNQGFIHSTVMHAASNLGVYLIHKTVQALS